MLKILTAQEILEITNPKKLFSGLDFYEVKKEYRKLSSLWHPDKHDINKSDIYNNVFQHINKLYEEAIDRINKGMWEYEKTLIIDTKDIKYQFKFLIEKSFDLGKVYIGHTQICYSFPKEHKDMYDNMIKNINKIKFANTNMQEQILRHLPIIKKEIKDEDRYYIFLAKTIDVISLEDVLNKYKKIDVKHVAWILSGLYNILCYFNYLKLNHNGITLDNIFISPKYHSVLLLGGWWNSVNENEKLFALNSHTVNICPNEILNSKISSSKIDLESIKLIGRELLDDKDGFKIINDSKIPKAFSQWLMFSNNLNVIDSYEYWQTKVLINSFGVRHFTKMDISYSDLYL